MAYTFSTDQQSVIDARHANVLVSAAAGSGKTSVLTERIVRRISDSDDPTDIDRILVVTFTNAAAREMKERISGRLNEELTKNPGNTHLQKQATLVHGALITTIDSFCLYLIRNHFHSIKLDPSFRVMMEGEGDLLKEDVLRDVIKRAYKNGSEDFCHVVDSFSKKDSDGTLEKAIFQIYDYSQSYPWPKLWLEKHRHDYDFDGMEAFSQSELIGKVKDMIHFRLGLVIGSMESLLEVCERPDGAYGYCETIEKDIEIARDFQKKVYALSWDDLCLYASMIAFPTLSRAKDDACKEVKEAAKKARDSYKKSMTAITDDYLGRTMEEVFAELEPCKRTVNVLIDLVEDFTESFDAAKRERGVIDFSDMEHMAVKILIKSGGDTDSYEITDAARAYRDFFTEVMIDEYQDSNLVQELIIKSVSREEDEEGNYNRFMVGDVKQSIYRFRLARPEIFMDKLDTYLPDAASSDRLITLKQNFRSRDSVIDSVNAVFEKIMIKETGGIEYDSDAMLYRGGEFSEDTDDNRTKIVLVPSEGRSTDTRKTEAEAIAFEIKRIVGNFDVWDKDRKELRKASYADIAVLFRGHTKWLNTMKDAFTKQGIPFHAQGVGAFYDTPEILSVMSFLRVLNNPLDDISLYASMTSEFGGFTDEECAVIKTSVVGNYRFLWDRLRKYAEDFPADEKVSGFVELVNRYRRLATVLPIDKLISNLFEDTGYTHMVSALPGGKQRLANVRLLVSKAREYSKTSFYGLFHFIRYVELIKKADRDEGEANTFDENSDAVRIMSIHASKGLEFPICIIGGIDESFSRNDITKAFVTDVDEGIGSYAIDPDRRLKTPSLRRKYIIDKIKNENLGEEIRVLYVAMTRAKEKLIMTGITGNAETWTDFGVSGRGSYLELIHDAVYENRKLFDVKVWDGMESTVQNALSEVSLSEKRSLFESSSKNPDEETLKLLRDRIAYKYGFEGLSKLYTKTTVSELKMAAMSAQEAESLHPFDEEETGEYIPVFAGGENDVKGTDRGTAYHSLLQLLEFEKLPYDMPSKMESALKERIDEIVLSGKMTKEDVSKVFTGKILDFLATDIARKMHEAAKEGNLYKEQPFVIGVYASEVEEDFPSDETILVQGVIDVYYIKDGKVTVLDYKTDRVDSRDRLVNRYKKQLEYYAEAITKLTGLPVEQSVIYSFGLNEVIVVE